MSVKISVALAYAGKERRHGEVDAAVGAARPSPASIPAVPAEEQGSAIREDDKRHWSEEYRSGSVC